MNRCSTVLILNNGCKVFPDGHCYCVDCKEARAQGMPETWLVEAQKRGYYIVDKFDWKEEERIFEIVSEKVKKETGTDHCSTSIVWRRGNDFIVAAWYNVDIASPEWDQDTKYCEQHIYHVCLRVQWKQGKRFLKVVDAHEGANLTWYGKFSCGSCAGDLGHRELY